MANLNPTELYMPALRTGLAWAQSWTKGHILCRLGHGRLTLMVAESNGFLAVWSYPMTNQDDNEFFLIPPFIARTLSGRAAWDIERLEILTNRNVVGAMLYTAEQDFRLQWKWRPASFQAPRHFKHMSQLPDMTVRAPYVNLADHVHLAFANMMNPALITEDLPPDEPKGGILIDFMPGQINIDGESLHTGSQQARYYFNPKMLMRGLEIVRESHLSFTIHEIQRSRTAVLFLGCQREGWDIHCAVQSIGVSHQANTTPMRIRETKTPMQGGSWLQGARTEE